MHFISHNSRVFFCLKLQGYQTVFIEMFFQTGGTQSKTKLLTLYKTRY